MVSKPDPVDVHVGSRVRLRRTLLGMSQEKLGQAVDLTFQQIQKYERGANRIGASRLHQFSTVLDVPVSFFFDDMASSVARSGAPGMAEDEEPFEQDKLVKRETLELVRAYYKITDAALRKRVFELVKAVAASGRAGGAAGSSSD
ncbi:MAG: helix-turn-helix transcriptional regulator [Alphaproteobacteria bacterium]|nr:helix-turn-helix transcriptional regulator [Alphaproteobacteria bacterium]